MAKQQSKRAQREAARRAKERRQRMTMTAVIAAVVLILGAGAFVVLGGGSGSGEPSPAADFSLTSAEGETVKLSDYRGQPVALTFMHTY